MLTKTSIIMMIMTPFMNHPMSLGMMLITQTIMLSIIMSMKSYMSWFSYILFITIIGGMMVMFMYMASIASNEKFKNTPIKFLIMMIIIMMMIMKLEKDKTIEIIQMTEINKMNMNQKEEMKSTSKFFNLNKMNITITLMMTLLLTMVSVTNISNSNEGPLKKN